MKVSKWYQVLVVGSATALSSACGTSDTHHLNTEETGEPDAQAEQDSALVSEVGYGADAESLADMAINTDAESLACSTSADPGDPCGCPCCWAVGFLNTDPECAGFCSAGDNGAGCCSD